MPYFEIPIPLGGFSEGLPIENQEGATSGFMLNCRPRDVLENKFRLGQRLGMKKAYTQQIGENANFPVVWIGSITVMD